MVLSLSFSVPKTIVGLARVGARRFFEPRCPKCGCHSSVLKNKGGNVFSTEDLVVGMSCGRVLVNVELDVWLLLPTGSRKINSACLKAPFR